MKKLTMFLAALAVTAPVALAVSVDARPVFLGVEGGDVAVSGYDAVSYFRGNGAPVQGSDAWTVKYDGGVYKFASEENMKAFRADPGAYAPKYGGHCAWAMANGYLAPGDPMQYEVVDGRLYLNFNAEVKSMWVKDIPGFIVKSEKNWVEVPDDAVFGEG